MLAPMTAPPGAVGDPTTPHRVHQGRPSAGGQAPSPRPGPNHLRASGLQPGTCHALPGPMNPVPLAIHGSWIGAIPTAHTQIKAGPDTRKDPPARPQLSLTCEYHAIHRVLSRVGLSPELAYPLSTTDQEVHQIRKLVCETFAMAAEDGKLLLQNAQPTTDNASCKRTHTPTQHTPPHPCPSPLAAHPETHTRPPSRAPPGPATRASPTRPNNGKRTPRTHPPDTPHRPRHSTTRTHPPRGAPRPTAHPARPVAHPAVVPQRRGALGFATEGLLTFLGRPPVPAKQLRNPLPPAARPGTTGGESRDRSPCAPGHKLTWPL